MDPASSQTQLSSPPVPSLQALLTAGANSTAAAADNAEDYSDMPPLEPMINVSRARRRSSPSIDMQRMLLGFPGPPFASSAAVAPSSRRSPRAAAVAARAAIASRNEKHPGADDLGGTTKKRRARAKRSPPNSLESSSRPAKRARTSSRKPPPNAKKDSDYEDQKQSPEDSSSCCICMCEPEREELSRINGCEHLFCFACIGKWADHENTCPLCKTRFSKIERVFPQKRKKGQPSVSNSKRVKQRDQRSDIVTGAALEGLLASITATGAGPGGSRLGRLLFARMGSTVFPMQAGNVARSARLTFSVEDNLFDSDDDDDDSFYPNFMNVIMRSTLQAHRGPFAASVSATTTTARSYATNSNDNNAGRAASNPLEIDDSDDDDVEVVRVARRS